MKPNLKPPPKKFSKASLTRVIHLRRLPQSISLILLSFAVAFVMWIFAKASQTDETRISVPVVVTPTDARVEVRITPEAVPVTLRYPRSAQRDINSENFHFEVDARDLRDALSIDWKTKTQALGRENLVMSLPRRERIDVLKVGTQSNGVEIQMRWNAQPATVEVDVTGIDRLPAGFQLVTPVQVTPREVFVAGDAQAFAKAPRDPDTGRIRLTTGRINVANRSTPGEEQVTINVPQGLEIVQPSSVIATANLEIQEVQSVREIRGVPLVFQALSSDTVRMEYKEKNAAVTVYGPQSLLPELSPASFEIVLQRPAEELPNTEKDVPIEARFVNSIPEATRARLTIKSIDPKSIKVKYVAETKNENIN